MSGALATNHYSLYGLSLQSPLVLPCPRVGRCARPDVRLRPGGAARFARARAAAGLGARRFFQSRRLPDGTTYLRWTGVFEFLVSRDGRLILYRRLARATRESFSVYLLGQVLSCSLLASGDDPLHGTVVAIDGTAVAFVGDCGHGKSTLAAALLMRGHRVVADDLVVLDMKSGRWVVHPGIPRLKLFPRVARRVLGREVHGSRMIRGTSKLVLPLGRTQSLRKPLPLGAIYVLSDPARIPTNHQADPIVVERLSNADAFLEVIRAAFNLLVLERGRYENQFRLAARLVQGVPIRRLAYPRDLSALPAVCDAVLADMRSGCSLTSGR